jgi:hypothetical protein
MSATVASAQVVKIELFADANHTSCQLVDTGGLVTVYAVQTGPVQSGLVRFKAPKPACWTGATWVGDSSIFASVGDSQTDWAISWGQCRSLPVVAGQILYITTGASQPCCSYLPQRSPIYDGYDSFTWTDCSFGEHPSTVGSGVTINANASCSCQSPVATQPATWGRLKALYR